MCVYSCENTSRSQSLAFPIVLCDGGGTAASSIVLYGNTVAHPFDWSV